MQTNKHSVQKLVTLLLHEFVSNNGLPGSIEKPELDEISSLLEEFDKPNWELLERLGVKNVLISIFMSLIDPELVPFQILERWRRCSVQAYYIYLKSEEATAAFTEILDKEGIPVVAMRGMALVQWVYPDPTLRPMVDVDLLIPAKARFGFVKQIENHGLTCVRKKRSQFDYSIDGITIEVHWSFLTPKRYRDAADFGHWLEARQKFTTASGTIYCFTPEHELLDLVFHAFIHHELDTLLKLIDICLVAQHRELDWVYLSDWCRQASMSRLFAFTLGLVDYIFNSRFLDEFQGSEYLPANPRLYYEAFLAQYFMRDTVSHFLRRKRILLYIAEKPSTKASQIIRFFSLDHIHQFKKALTNRDTNLQ